MLCLLQEERFLFPIYPLLCLNAAICLAILPVSSYVVQVYVYVPRVQLFQAFVGGWRGWGVEGVGGGGGGGWE